MNLSSISSFHTNVNFPSTKKSTYHHNDIIDINNPPQHGKKTDRFPRTNTPTKKRIFQSSSDQNKKNRSSKSGEILAREKRNPATMRLIDSRGAKWRGEAGRRAQDGTGRLGVAAARAKAVGGMGGWKRGVHRTHDARAEREFVYEGERRRGRGAAGGEGYRAAGDVFTRNLTAAGSGTPCIDFAWRGRSPLSGRTRVWPKLSSGPSSLLAWPCRIEIGRVCCGRAFEILIVSADHMKTWGKILGNKVRNLMLWDFLNEMKIFLVRFLF